MHLSVYLPVAGITVNVLVMAGVGGIVGLLSGLFGVGGGWLLTPLLMMFGIPATVAAATDANQIVGASTSGTFAHWRLGNVDFKMGVLMLVGGVIGSTAGVQLIKILRASGNADLVIKLCYVTMLGAIGSLMFVESLLAMRRRSSGRKPMHPKEMTSWARIMAALPMQTEFKKSGVRASLPLVFAIGVLVGVLAAVMGVGGGFFMAPVMVYLLAMPMHVVVGTSLFIILFTTMNTTFMQAVTNHTVDIMLAVILLLGSTLGAQIGSRVGNRLEHDQLKILLASIVLVVTVKMIFDLSTNPDHLLAMMGGH
jgi:uncharacterized membrane protein YfcA